MVPTTREFCILYLPKNNLKLKIQYKITRRTWSVLYLQTYQAVISITYLRELRFGLLYLVFCVAPVVPMGGGSEIHENECKKLGECDLSKN